MKLKSVELEATALLSEVVFGHGYAHYGYFPDGPPAELTAEALGAAQHAYFERLVAAIGTVPGEVQSILDVGSGTGANAKGLISRGFHVSCVSPSKQMNDMARRKLPVGTSVTDARFEDYSDPTPFDVCIFAESFHYIDLPTALQKSAILTTKGVVVFDYFRRDGFAHDNGTRGTHAAFLAELEKQGSFRVISNEDVTEAIAPTFEIYSYLKTEKLAPFLDRMQAAMRQLSPWRAWALEKVFGRALQKLRRPSTRSETFAQEHEYRLIVLERL